MSTAFRPTQSCYSIKEAVTYLRVSDASVRRLIKRGLLRTSKALGRIKILGESVETFYERTS